MSTYEKMILVVIAATLILMSVFSYHEYKEPSEQSGAERSGSHFDESRGQDFKIGPFVSVLSERSFGGTEENCALLHPVIIAALHDIKERLEAKLLPSTSDNVGDAFEVNDRVIRLFCNKNVEVTMGDTAGNKLILKKMPFQRTIPTGGSPLDIGTELHINATVIYKGTPEPTEPTTSGDILIPDRFLDATVLSAP